MSKTIEKMESDNVFLVKRQTEFINQIIKKGGENMTAKKIMLEEDFIIPKGTMFELMEGNSTFYKDANYKALISVNKDNCGVFIVGTEIEDSGFMPIPEQPYDAYFSYKEYKDMWESLKSAKCKGDKALEVSLKALMKSIEEKY